MPQQLWLIHGGDTFNTYDEYLTSLNDSEVSLDDLRQLGWKSSLPEALGPDFEILAPRMPNSSNAKYAEWSLWFSKFVPFMTEPVILDGHSLGGLFLAKYLTEHIIPVKVRATFLIAAPHTTHPPESLADFILPASLENFQQQSQEIFLYHSEDDPVVPFADVKEYQIALPQAHVKIFTDRQHFNQPELPELVADISGLTTHSRRA